MKTNIALSALAVTLSSFTSGIRSEKNTEPMPIEVTAQQVIEALKKESYTIYEALFPTLADFNAIMDQQAYIYGQNLDEAKQEFTHMYINQVIPALHDSFEKILEYGKAQQIDWSKVKLVRIEHTEISNEKFDHADMNIVFKVKGEEKSLVVKNALIINGQWKLSQFTAIK